MRWAGVSGGSGSRQNLVRKALVVLAAAGAALGSNYGPFDQVVETLPPGFSYEGSHLSEAAVVVEGQTVAFTLLGDERFTYAVAASRAEGSYSFSGVLLAEAEG